MNNNNKKVLSIQSSVVYGYVGNKAAMFPLQLSGYDVSPINTVQFSNHTGYNKFSGARFCGDDMKELLIGLRDNIFLSEYTHIMTGYCGDASFLKEIILMIKEIKLLNKNIFILIDPVMGDSGKLYVKQELVELYKEQLIPMASLITPNQFEAELLTQQKINNINDVINIFKYFHEKLNISMVIITSLFIESDYILCVGSHKDVPNQHIEIKIPKINYYFSGTGDLSSALLLKYIDQYQHKTPIEQIKLAIENTMTTVYHIVNYTMKCKSNELKLIQSRHVLDDVNKANVKLEAFIINH